MRTPRNNYNDWTSLRDALRRGGNRFRLFMAGTGGTLALSDLTSSSVLYNRGGELNELSVLVITSNQLTMAHALIELDGLAKRVVLCPPDFPVEHLAYVLDSANVEAIVSDRVIPEFVNTRPVIFCPCSRHPVPARVEQVDRCQTEWILLTSGTTGLPKLVVHTLSSLAGAIKCNSTIGSDAPIVWSTFYDIRRYGGLQIFLRAILCGTSLVLSDSQETTSAFLARAASCGVTHISGTPSHWRYALMSAAAHLIRPEYVRLSGEIADQAILHHLQSAYPHAHIVHAFASTEAGVAFEVTDGLAGFPASVIDQTPDVAMKITNGSLLIKSARTASHYMGSHVAALRDDDGFVDTSDMLELRNGRYYFIGRRDGVINIGGLKVHPEEVEAVINRHPAVQASLVRMKRSPVTGGLVIADVVLDITCASLVPDKHALHDEILLLCREALSSHQVPAAINFLPALSVTASGKVLRHNA